MRLREAMQDAYTKAYRGLESQNWRQSTQSTGDDSGMCVYRGTEGRKCAVGWVIPDAVYTPGMEGKGVTFAMVEELYPDLNEADQCSMQDFLRDLQNLHDDCEGAKMKNAFVVYGRNHELVIPENTES